MQKQIHKLKIKFIAKLGAMGKYKDGQEKYHVMIPKQYFNQVKDLRGTDVRIVIDNEI
jgi:hypothetical protein